MVVAVWSPICVASPIALEPLRSLLSAGDVEVVVDRTFPLADRGTARDGPIPVNTSGGLKSKGHPIAASGIAQVVECSEQLLERADPRQVADGTTALASNVGGFGTVS